MSNEPVTAGPAAKAAAAVTSVAYVLLLQRWFVAPAAAGAPRTTPVWPFVLLFLLLAAVTGFAYRAMLAGLRRELAAALWLPRREVALLAAVLVVSLVVQLPTMFFPARLLHSDAALNGLMGLHIAQGRVPPAFYYGQEFMGTLFSHALALMFAVTGPFVAGTTLLTWLFWAGFLSAMFLLLRRAAGALVAAAVTLWLAVPPSLLLITLAQSEYAQFFLLSGWGLFIVAAGIAGPLRDPEWWVIAGLILGSAFWAHPMAAMVIAAAVLSVVVLAPRRTLMAASWRLPLGIFGGLLPALVGWGARLGRFVQWFLEGGGRGGDETLAAAAAGLARMSLGDLLLGTEGRGALATPIAAALLAIVLGGALWCTVMALAARRARTFDSLGHAAGQDGVPRGGESVDRPAGEDAVARAAAALPLALFVLIQVVVLLARRYAVVPTQYIVPLYLGLPAVVAVAGFDLLRRRLRRAAPMIAAGVVLWACIPLPGTVAFLRSLPANQASMNASLAVLRGAGIDTCIGPYWDAYRLSYLTLEAIICESIDVRRVPGYRERVAQRSAGPPPFVAAPQRRAALEQHRDSLDRRGIPWLFVRTTRFEALLPERR